MKAKLRIFQNSFLYIFSSLLVKAISFFLLPIYTRYLSTSDYGTINLLTSFSNVATYLIAFSLYSSVIRFYVDYKDEKEKVRRLFGTIIIFVMISGAVFFSIMFVFRGYINRMFFEGVSFFPFILISMTSMTFIVLHSIHQSIMKGMQEGKRLTVINIIVFFIQISLNLLFIIVFDMKALGVLSATLIVNVFYFFFMIYDLRKNNLMIFTFDRSIIKDCLRYSIPIIPHDLSTHIAQLASRVFINKEGSLDSVGLYSISSQFGAITDIVQASVNHAFQPWFFETMNEGKESGKKSIINISLGLLIFYTIIYLFIGLFSQDIVILLTAKSFWLAWTPIPIIVVAYSIKSIYYFYINILFYNKNATRWIFIATLTGSISDIVIASLMIPLYGIYGAALSFLVAKMVVVIVVIIISRKYNDVGYKVSSMLKILIPFMLFLGVGLYPSYVTYIDSFVLSNFFYKTFIFVLYLVFLYISNFKRINNIISIIDFKKMISKLFKKEKNNEQE